MGLEGFSGAGCWYQRWIDIGPRSIYERMFRNEGIMCNVGKSGKGDLEHMKYLP